MTFPKLQLAISPCPNDTLIFGAWIQNFLPDSIPPRVEFHDIQTLNERARRGTDDVVKVSFHAAAHLLSDYALLRCGGALGRGCGPLLVSSRHFSADELSALPVAIPGELTTAALLLRLWNPQLINLVSMPFHEIMPAIVRGDVAAGAIIHESRFTFGDFGLRSLVDLGEWWESETGAPIPLGGILIRRSLGKEVALQVEKMIRSSLQYGWDHLEALQPFISLHAQEMNPEVQRQHIELYVNSFSMDYGVEGERAIRLLFEEAHRKGIIPKIQEELFLT